ncbi:hypothetical protein ABPG74_014482 [Tetrahymena malaccensis]
MDNKQNQKKLILAIESQEYEDWIASIQTELNNQFEIVVLRPNPEEKNVILQKMKVYEELAKQTSADLDKNLGIIICGSGLEASIALNKYKGIRAGLVSTYYLAVMTRMHNNANIMVIGADHTGKKAGIQFVLPFLTNNLEVGPGKYHATRVDKLTNIQNYQQTSC